MSPLRWTSKSTYHLTGALGRLPVGLVSARADTCRIVIIFQVRAKIPKSKQWCRPGAVAIRLSNGGRSDYPSPAVGTARAS
jgi:hypothetical protein